MTKTKRAADVPIYQLKVTLQGSKPPIWRRLQVRSDTTLAELHEIIQTAFDWWDEHLHQFTIGKRYYGVPNPDYLGFVEMHDERKIRLQQITRREGFKFLYEYDFGDSWLHQTLVEKILPAEPGQVYPVCITGRRAAPLEDIGGIWGWYYFLEVLQDPEHEDHEEYMDWVEDNFDPEAFDLEATNRALRSLRRQ